MNRQASQVSLRSLTADDIDAFMVWATDPDVTRYLSWEIYRSRQEAEIFFKKIVEQYPWFQAIVVNDEVIGSLTLEQRTADYRCKAELGYVSARKYWGHGYMTQAVQLAVQRGFQELGLARIEVLTHLANTASQNVLKKNGFVREALLKNAIIRKDNIEDLYLYAVTQ